MATPYLDCLNTIDTTIRESPPDARFHINIAAGIANATCPPKASGISKNALRSRQAFRLDSRWEQVFRRSKETVACGAPRMSRETKIGQPLLMKLALISVTLLLFSCGGGNTTSAPTPTPTPVTATVAVGAYPAGVAANSVTNQICVVNNHALGSSSTGSVTVIDGATNNSTTTVAALPLPIGGVPLD